MPDLRGAQEYSKRGAENVYAVILVGGKGKRLRPLSTDSRPKAFLSITRDGKTMFRRTVERVAGIVHPENILVAANRKHAALVKKDLPRLADKNIILETVSRNTAPAIALAAHTLRKRGIDPVMVVLPTDQYIMDVKDYLNAVRDGINFVRENIGAVVVLGARPMYPATGYGYVRIQDTGNRKQGVRKVEKFVEKPDLKLAKKYVGRGGYLWNTGLFIFRASAILDLMKKFSPKIYDGIKNTRNYHKLPDISIDYAVMEKADNIYCVEGNYEWQDMGNFDSIKAILELEGRGFKTRGGKVVKII